MSYKEFCRRTEDYFSVYLAQNDEIADVEGLCCYLGISRDEFFELAKKQRFKEKINRALCKIAAIKKQLAFKGKIPASIFSVDFKNNHGYTEKKESDEEALKSGTVILEGKSREWSE